jgi:site-specific recombinase, resolvase family
MNRAGKKCILYPRVSTEMQVDGYSLDGQKNSLKRFAEREEMQIVGIYEDAGKSGKSIEGRPAFKRMLSDIQERLEVDYILVYKLSRFGRNAADILNSLEFIQSYGVNLLCMEEGIDSSQTSGKLLISVLSAVAEIERENILEQTMNGRREKARQGKWNGGPAPYGYSLKNDTLVIEEDEAEIVRTIFDKFAHTNMGYTGIAKYLNLQGIKKTPRKKTDIEEFSAHFIKILLDNPVYCGKIAYGRRTREKVKGTKSDYKVVHKQDYCLVDGLHEGIIDEELWEKAHEKRRATGVKFASKYGKERTHLLTGIIKCPKCGSGMYANRVCWTKKDGTYKEVMYYACSRNKQERGRSCDYSANLKKTDIEPLVIEFIKDLVQDEHFAAEIKRKIGLQVDTTKIDMEIHNYENKLKEVELNKARLEREIDSLPIDVAHRERKIHDMTLRLDGLYDTIAEIEVNIEDAKTRRKSVEAEFITMENIYKILQHFNELYDIMSDEEKKELIFTLVNEIQIYPEGESEIPLKSMKFNFPVYKDGKEVREIILNNGNNVKTLVVLRRN